MLYELYFSMLCVTELLCSNELATAKIENVSAVYSIESGVYIF